MFELFPDQPVYEFPSILNIAYAMLWAVVLSSLIGITHKVTFKGLIYPVNFFQSLILGSIITSLVMMAIGDSLARGLGVFGAMAIIRFRTIVVDPRDVLFLFASLSIGLAIGVFGYTVAFVGTIMFCTVALLINFTAFKLRRAKMQLNFTLTDPNNLPEVTTVLKTYCDQLINLNVGSGTNKFEETVFKYQYYFTFKSGQNEHTLISELLETGKVTQVKISMEETIR